MRVRASGRFIKRAKRYMRINKALEGHIRGLFECKQFDILTQYGYRDTSFSGELAGWWHTHIPDSNGRDALIYKADNLFLSIAEIAEHSDYEEPTKAKRLLQRLNQLDDSSYKEYYVGNNIDQRKLTDTQIAVVKTEFEKWAAYEPDSLRDADITVLEAFAQQAVELSDDDLVIVQNTYPADYLKIIVDKVLRAYTPVLARR